MEFFEEQRGESSNRFKPSSCPSSAWLPTLSMRAGEYLRAGQIPLTLAAKGEDSPHTALNHINSLQETSLSSPLGEYISEQG